jgi:lipoprotein-anchoring transpeptidase ErfK/SrfK
VRVLDKDGKLIAFYPASIGSEEKPAPSGMTKVTNIVKNPPYTYNPKYDFKEVKAAQKFTIKPGPNNPVGLVWIALTGEGYGIHGTPEPSNIGHTQSHGCVRLTNWDAARVAALVKPGTPVRFE